MKNIKQILNFAYDNAYESAYDLTVKKNFSTPKIYSAKGDLLKRWYVYFSFRDPNTSKLKRITPFYGIANDYKTKEERMEVLLVYRKVLLKLLQQGYNPYEDNTDLHRQLQLGKNSSNQKKIEPLLEKVVKNTEEGKMPLKEALSFGLKLKEKLLSDTTIRSYKNRIDNFIKWLNENEPSITTIDLLNKRIISFYLNSILEKTSARNRNNYRTDLSSILQVLEDNDIIEQNFVKKIPVLKSIPERNKTYTQETQEEIFSYLEEKDPILLLYIKFISYNFLRPIEVCRLKVGDINLIDKTIQFKAKNSPLKTKIIPNLLYIDLPDLSSFSKETVLFTPNQIGGEWDALVNNRRDYFSKRFKRVVKDHFNLGADYGLYSFRHTYITKLYRAMVKESSPFEAKSKLMLITGHSSMKALEKYLRDIDAELPTDYSEMLKRTDG